MARDSSEVATEVVAALTHRERPENPTEHVNFNIDLGRDNLYSMTSLPYDHRDIERQQGDILRPLSLFAPYVHEEDLTADDLTPERPVTPLTEEIRCPCTTFRQLSRYVLRRLKADEPRPFLDVEDLEELAGVLLGELNGIWTEFSDQADDPFLTKTENSELKRLMTVRIVEICKSLYYQYVEKAQILNRRGVFTGPANVSRLKSQLGLDAHKRLNIPSIRRWAADAMQDEGSDDGICDKLSEKPRRRSPRKPGVPSVRQPRRRGPKSKPFSVDDEVRELRSEMPQLKTERLMSVLQEMDQLRDRPPTKSESKRDSYKPENTEATWSGARVKRSHSLEERNRRENLAYELELDLKATLTRSDSTHLINIPCLMKADTAGVESVVQRGPASDLDNLMARHREDIADDQSEDMPPLIQAITRNAKHDNKKEKIAAKLRELEEKEAEYIKRTKVRPHEKPTYPQPSTVPGKLPNHMPIRASDVRVSERVCMSSFTINTFGPIYNDLSGEVDQATVKSMDKNLFMGDEIREVYHEIMKTIPDDHLTLSNDELVLPAADSVNLSAILMPSALQARTREKIVNKSLQKAQQPPWKNQNVMTWAKTPVTQLKEVSVDEYGRKTESEEIAPGLVLTLEEYRDRLANCPRQLQERLTRNYQSWLTWWKSSLSTEDYHKFLASQETDYLCYMLHYYDSEDEDDDAGAANASKNGKSDQPSRSEGAEEQMASLKAEKEAYTPGYWNPCSVLMGGLGKDPILDEDRPQSPASEQTQSYLSVGKRIRLKSETMPTARSVDSELTRTIQNKQNASMAEAQRIAEANAQKGPTPQERLERVWTILQMPDHLRLDMAIKYSTDAYIGQLDEAIKAWERATDVVIEREKLLSQLENFERLASDPNRFFVRGFRGSSVARLEEAKQRSFYYKQLDEMTDTVNKVVNKLQTEFRDVLSFQGRPYLEKMHFDRIEMLFWLQEERKQNVMEKHTMARAVQLELNPIESNLHIF